MRHSATPTLGHGVGIAVVAAALVVLLLVVFYHRQPFFVRALKAVHASSTVVVEGVSYQVQGGTIVGSDTLSAEQTSRILAIAFALEQATKRPLLGIAGTDPATLQEAARTLDTVMAELAAIQEDAESTAKVRTLYPTAYLQALAHTEIVRQQFIHSASDQDFAVYIDALEDTVAALHNSAKPLLAALSTEIEKRGKRWVFAGGTIKTPDYLSWLQATRQHIDTLATDVSDLRACITEDEAFCSATDIEAPIPVAVSRERASDASVQLVDEVQMLRQKTTGRPTDTDVLWLHQSACIGLPPGPYPFSIGGDTYIHYVGDLFFLHTASSTAGSLYQYLATNYDVAYYPFVATFFYTCPDALDDLSRAYTVQAVIDFARNNPALTTAGRDRLLAGTTYYEADARAYLRTILQNKNAHQHLSAEQLDMLYTIARMFEERRAGLDTLVGQITKLLSRHIAQAKKGVPYKLDYETLLLTHVPVFSLLSLGQDPVIKSNTEEHVEAYLSQMVRYSTLRDSVSHEKLIHDSRIHQALESGLLLSAPDLAGEQAR